MIRCLAFCITIIFIFTIGAFAATTERTPSNMSIPTLPEHPRLLLSAQGITEMKDRIQRFDWADKQWNSIKKNADSALDEDVVLPPRGSNWFHWYACPKHGCPLKTGKQIGPWQWEHKCPIGGEIYLGDPTVASKDYDGCALADIHTRWSHKILDLGIAYQITGDIHYASKARDILLAYAQQYQNYPLHDVNGKIGPYDPKKKGAPGIGGGKVGPQNLDESVWLIPVCQGADLIWNTLTQADRDTIANKLLLPAVNEVIMPHPLKVHNIQCWRNSAIGLVGFLLGDKNLISYAIDNPNTGFHEQMAKGVTADGSWWEGAWSYHFYTLSAIWSLTEAAHNCGIDLYCPEFKSMFEAPIKLEMPNMHLPAFNDSGEVNLLSEKDIYELAYARYKDPIFLDLLDKSDRHNDFALYFGKPELPAPPPMEWKSRNYPRSGYAILARGKGDKATWLCMKYGPHGASHGHPDKLSFVLYAKGHVLGIDPGTSRYGLPIHANWYKTSLAHNTLNIDETTQKPSQGNLIAFGSEKNADFVLCDAGPIHDGVRFTRASVMLNENLIVFIDQIQADKDHIYDIAYHQSGKWIDLPSGSAWNPPDKPGYRYLEDATIRKADKNTSLEVAVAPDYKTRISTDSESNIELITATGVGANVEDRVPVVIFRKQGKDTSLAWCVSLDGKAAHIERLSVRDAGGIDQSPNATAIMVMDASGSKHYLLANPDKRAVVVSLPDGSKWQTQSAFAVR